jgi:hypothetical protein
MVVKSKTNSSQQKTILLPAARSLTNPLLLTAATILAAVTQLVVHAASGPFTLSDLPALILSLIGIMWLFFLFRLRHHSIRFTEDGFTVKDPYNPKSRWHQWDEVENIRLMPARIVIKKKDGWEEELKLPEDEAALGQVKEAFRQFGSRESISVYENDFHVIR